MLSAQSKGIIDDSKEKLLAPICNGSDIRKLRGEFNFSRSVFARCMACSERALANWESGRRLPNIYQSRLKELQTLRLKLAETVANELVGRWITTPNPSLSGLKPLEVIERGEIFRIWQLITSGGTASYDDNEP